LKHWKLPLKLKKNDIIKKGEELQPNRFLLFQNFFASKVLSDDFVTHPFFFHKNAPKKLTSFSSPGGCPSTHLGADPPYKASQPDTYCPDIWPGWDGCWGWGARQKTLGKKKKRCSPPKPPFFFNQNVIFEDLSAQPAMRVW